MYKKVKPYKGGVKGSCLISLKIDGVRALKNKGWHEGSNLPKYVSRNGKKLYNLDHLEFEDAEIFYKDWGSSVSLVRTEKGSPVCEDCVYPLDDLDERLSLCIEESPTHEFLQELFEKALFWGYEGLVLRYEDGSEYKMKPKETYDEVVVGFQGGKGKNIGVMGALLTNKGKVGTGFSYEERKYFQELHNKGSLVGSIIEVDCMGLTEKGKFRHPRYIRERFDK